MLLFLPRTFALAVIWLLAGPFCMAQSAILKVPVQELYKKPVFNVAEGMKAALLLSPDQVQRIETAWAAFQAEAKAATVDGGGAHPSRVRDARLVFQSEFENILTSEQLETRVNIESAAENAHQAIDAEFTLELENATSDQEKQSIGARMSGALKQKMIEEMHAILTPEQRSAFDATLQQ